MKANSAKHKIKPSLRQVSVRVLLLLSRLSILGVGLGLSACGTIPIAGTVQSTKAVCVPWRKITYSYKDTDLTRKQIKIHDQTGRNLRCWR